MNQKNQTKESLIAAAQEFRKYRAEADRLKGERSKLLAMCERRLRGEPSTCPRFFGHSFGAKWCDACLGTKDINEKYRKAAFKATAWQRALYGWCDKLKGKTMKRVPVKSSAIVSVGYDPEEQVLEIEFTSGTVSQYPGVPQGDADALMKAPSVGRYFQQYIRGNYTPKPIGG